MRTCHLDYVTMYSYVIPAEAGIQNYLLSLDPCLRRDDNEAFSPQLIEKLS